MVASPFSVALSLPPGLIPHPSRIIKTIGDLLMNLYSTR
jgi:hypothetical protein